MKWSQRFIVTFLVCVAFGAGAQQGKVVHQTVGGREADIYLPPGFDPATRYPLVLFNDGQSLFGADPASWQLQTILDRLIDTRTIQPVVVAGIYSTMNRTSDYVPYEDRFVREDFGPYQPAAEKYTAFLTGTLIPFMEKNYSAGSRRAIMGYSFGGSYAIWAAIHYPETFSMAAGFSPSFWVKDFAIFKEAKNLRAGQKIWLDIGTGEWNYYVPFLYENPLTYGTNLFYYEVPDATHTNASWRERAHNAFIAFAGTTAAGPSTWKINLEVIKSASTPGRTYLRLNPVISFANGFTYSLSIHASYKVLSPEAGTVNRDGSFVFKTDKDLEVEVEYKGEVKKFVVGYRVVEAGKR